MSADYYKFSNWKPSADITRCIEGTSGPRHTREWDNDGFEVTPDKNQPEIDLIPTQTRQSTPDSVMGTGKFVINRPDNQSGVEVNRTNLQDHAGQNGHHSVLPSTNGKLGISMRHLVHTENMHVKERNSLASPDNVQNGQHSVLPSTNGKLGISMRHLVHAENMQVRDSNSMASPDNVHLRPANPNEMDGALQRKMATEKKVGSCLVPKMIMLILALMIIIAGIVALIVTFKKSEYEGSNVKILPNPITYAECPDVTVKLGEKVNFTCSFDLTHELRKSLVAYQKSIIAPIDRIVSEEFLKFDEGYTKGTSLNILFTSDGWKARCSTDGRYHVYLYDREDKLLHEASVSIKLKSSFLNTTFEQHLKVPCPENGEVKTYFESTCSIAGDCSSYEPSIVRGRESLKHLMTCQTNFTDESGYSVKCKADIPEDLMSGSSHLRCRMTSAVQRLEKAFVLPECSMTPTCLTPTPEQPYPFNCSAKSTHYGMLMNASCHFDTLRNCLQPGRKIFDLHKTIDGKLRCNNMTTTVPVCRLSWCVDYKYTVKDIVPGQLLCGGNFLEQEYSPPPTKRPPNSTTSR